MDEDDLDQYFDSKTAGNDEDQYSGEDSDEEEEYPDNIDPNYELERAEPEFKSSQEFSKFLHSCEYPEDITKHLKSLKLFEKHPKTGDICPTKSLKAVVSGFIAFLLGTKRVKRPVLKGIAKLFGRFDIFHLIAPELVRAINNLKSSRTSGWFNLFHFLSFVPHPTDRVTKSLFRLFCVRSPFNEKSMKRSKLTWISVDYDSVWMAVMNGDVAEKLSLQLIPHVTKNVISKLRAPFKSADFFFKMFDKSDYHGILSLAAIFRLITEHNFEWPKFYDKVYSLTNPSLLYMSQKESILTLLDSFLSSTHIPTYIVASFIKRLSRCLLLAPIDAQEPILGLIRNLIIRHPNCSELVHREVPGTVYDDPFDNEEGDLHKTKALESSLWEMKILQCHWNQNVRKRAHFIDKPLKMVESFVRFRCPDELFSVNMAKSFGGEDGDAEKYRRLQDGDDEEEQGGGRQEPEKKKFRKGGKYAPKHEEKIVRAVGTNSEPPKGILERRVPIGDVPELWRI
uniref:CBF domain-containing protein n=1 Tax=Caenorhabditis tropicalis TaxID=1561998 RepID=A0A1I7TWW7_9PELO